MLSPTAIFEIKKKRKCDRQRVTWCDTSHHKVLSVQSSDCSKSTFSDCQVCISGWWRQNDWFFDRHEVGAQSCPFNALHHLTSPAVCSRYLLAWSWPRMLMHYPHQLNCTYVHCLFLTTRMIWRIALAATTLCIASQTVIDSKTIHGLTCLRCISACRKLISLSRFSWELGAGCPWDGAAFAVTEYIRCLHQVYVIG